MNTTVVGLGLIGGSFAKAIKRNTNYACFGIDSDASTVKKAILAKAIDKEIKKDELCLSDLVIVSLHPEAAIEFILNNADNFKKGSIVIDTAGVKKAVTDAVFDVLLKRGVCFIGAHPMAGRECWGFDYSDENLFNGASFIITPLKEDTEKIALLTDFAKQIGFGKVVISTPEQHDRIIAFSSQLAHVVSNAYIKSPSLDEKNGFSAGSYLDLTRVAKLNEDMWTELFMMNAQPLVFEIDNIIENMKKYRDAIARGDRELLKNLLKEGRILKEKDLGDE